MPPDGVAEDENSLLGSLSVEVISKSLPPLVIM